jgi:hypothetical protein
MKTFISFKYHGKGWATTESLTTLCVGLEDKCISSIERKDSINAAYIYDEQQYFQLFEGLIDDGGYTDCSECWVKLWLKLKYNYNYEGIGFYDYTDYKYQGQYHYENDLDNYYLTAIDDLSEKELGALLNDNYSECLSNNMRFDLSSIIDDICDLYGVTDDSNVTTIEARDYDPNHSGYELDATYYYYDNILYNTYPEIED